MTKVITYMYKKLVQMMTIKTYGMKMEFTITN